jgi:hypothetical protein
VGIIVGVSLTFLFYNCSSVPFQWVKLLERFVSHEICYCKRTGRHLSINDLIRPATMRPFREARFVGGPDADRVPRVYIKTMHDRAFKLEQQDAMIKRWPPFKVFVLESDHSPFFSNPSLLFGFLLEAAASVKCI